MNPLWITGTFRSGYKQKRAAPEKILDGVREGIRKLRSSSIPESLGEKKRGGLGETRAYRINLENRILYGVRRVNETAIVALFRVCDHPTVYQGAELTTAEGEFFTQVGTVVLAQTTESERWFSDKERADRLRRARTADRLSMYR
jgi:hypothetical protein